VFCVENSSTHQVELHQDQSERLDPVVRARVLIEKWVDPMGWRRLLVRHVGRFLRDLERQPQLRFAAV
jgi:hypothetical protein